MLGAMRRFAGVLGSVALTALVLLATVTATAQCAGGRVVDAATEGRCCWPGQTWDAAAGRCAGAPRCPEGLGGAGDECVVVAAAPVATAGPVVAPAPAVGTTPIAAPAWGASVAVPQSTEGSTGPDMGLVIAGGVTLGVGYLYSVIMGPLLAAWYQEDALTLLVPVVGGAIWPVVEAGRPFSCATCTLPYAMPNLGVQTIGLIVLIVGLVARVSSGPSSTTARPGSPTVSLARDGAGLAFVF
jgi:hypothetical protein